MPKGGARSNSGPPPDPEALRRDRPEDKQGWTLLPVDGRQGPAPSWPLPPAVLLAASISQSEDVREKLEVQIDSGDAPRGAHAKLAKLDQRIAQLTAQLEATERMEGELWEQLWATPQAVAWERLKWTREVALYVRLQIAAELGDLDAGKEARQWSDRLGLNPNALLRNRWRIVDPTGEVKPTGRKPPGKSTSSAKGRLKVVKGGKG